MPRANIKGSGHIACIYRKLDLLGGKTDCKWIGLGGVKNGSSDQFLTNFTYVASTGVRRGDETGRSGTKVVHTGSQPVSSKQGNIMSKYEWLTSLIADLDSTSIENSNT